jgi:outer membrane protein TolC
MHFAVLIAVIAAAISVASPPGYAGDPLSLREALAIALQAQDPTVTSLGERATALSEKAVSDSQLPDPKLHLRMLNMPVDTFDFNQEPNTQAQIGLQQQFPPGRTLGIRRQRRLAEASEEDAKALLQESQIRLDTRTNWYELFYWLGADGKVADSQRAVEELVSVAQSIFATGRQSSQDVLRAELELSLLNDRLIQVSRRIELVRANLARYIGPGPASRPLVASLPQLTPPPGEDGLRRVLVTHPAVQVDNARIEVREHDIGLAEQRYKPEFSVDLNYGARGGDRSDFVTGMVGMSLPIFPNKRQDRDFAAAQHQFSAALLDRDARLLELNKTLARAYADWRQLGERITLYNKVVIQRAADTTDASLTAYTAGVSDFAELIRSRLAQLDNELTLLRLRVDRAQAHARLLFLAGK